MNRFTPSRRAFAVGALAVGAAPWPTLAAPLPAAPVVAFFRDELYVDWTGRDLAYEPPSGSRSAAPVEHLSEAELRELMGWPT